MAGSIAVTVDVSNLGQSSIPEPLNQLPGSTSTADAGPSQVAVYFTSRVHATFGQRILLGTIDVPAIPQNRLARSPGSSPSRPGPAGLPGDRPERLPDRRDRPDPASSATSTGPTTPSARPRRSCWCPGPPRIAGDRPGVAAGAQPRRLGLPQVKVANYGAAPTAAPGAGHGPGRRLARPGLRPGRSGAVDIHASPTSRRCRWPRRRTSSPATSTLTDPPNVVTLDAEPGRPPCRPPGRRTTSA